MADETPRPPKLTRDLIEDGLLQRLLAAPGLPFRVLTKAERDASLEATLSAGPGDGDVWLFGYGSLIWNPAIDYAERSVATIFGWHRRFCLSTPAGRGTPERPGLVLGLDRGGSCRGVVYRIPADQVRRELAVIWRREMVIGSYRPHWVRAARAEGDVPAIAFVIDRSAPTYEPPMPWDNLIERLAHAAGEIGSSADYLFETVRGLELAGVPDRHLAHLAAAVRRRQAEAAG